MSAFMKNLATATVLATSVSSVSAQASGSGSTTRYWDCCKPSCAWSGKADVSAPVGTCDIDDNPLDDPAADSSCDGGGPAYMCSDNSPWVVDEDLAYGYAAVSIAGGDESSWCCSCFELTFTSGPVSGKKMVVQGVNTGADLSTNQFDIAIPGGGVGIFDGCSSQWEEPEGGWGEQYGGISSNTCPSFPEPLVDGCAWRFDWFENADNPTVDFEQVECPAEITNKTGCTRSDEGSLRSPKTPRGFTNTPVRVPGAEIPDAPAAPAFSPSSSSTPISSSWTTSPLVRRQWPTGSISSSTPSSSSGWSWPTDGWSWPGDDEHEHARRQDWPSFPSSSATSSSSGGWPWPGGDEHVHARRQDWPPFSSSSTPTPSSSGGWPWPTEGWPWPGDDDDDDEHEHARRQDWPSFPSSSATPSSSGGWSWPGEDSWPPRDQNNNVRRQWPFSSSSATPSPSGGWPWPGGDEHMHARRQDWPPFSSSSATSSPSGGWSWPGEDSWPPRDQNNNVRRQWPSSSWSWPVSSSTPTPSSTPAPWSQNVEDDQGHDHVRRQDWPPFSWPTSFSTPTGFPTPTGGWPWPTGEFPWPPSDDEGFEDEE